MLPKAIQMLILVAVIVICPCSRPEMRNCGVIYVLNLLRQPPELSAAGPLVTFGTDSGGSKCINVSKSS